MSVLIDRERELDELDFALRHRSSRLLAVSGRRRLGKTTLLLHWANKNQHPYLYWVGSRLPSGLLLQDFSQQVAQFGNLGEHIAGNFSYHNWSQALETLARICQDDQRRIVILDEFPYAVASESALPSLLQNAWDHHLRHSNVCMVLCGSHVGMMESLVKADAPLYGRVSGPLRVRPLPFSATAAFLPAYSAAQRVAVYAILGGVPAYLEQFSDELSLGGNIKEHLFREYGVFRTDPNVLIADQVRDPTTYNAILTAIAAGSRRPTEIATAAKLSHSASAGPYLTRLVEMDYVHCKLPVTVPLDQQHSSRLGRYVLADNFLRFYFRFVHPNIHFLDRGLKDQVENRISEQLRAFIGMTAFEELCQEWIWSQARANKLPFDVDQVGAQWSRIVQVDVAAISWRDKALLLGEAKWGTDTVGRNVIRELIEKKTPKVLTSLPDSGKGWRIYYAFFARNGFTDAARELAQEHDAWLVDLATLDRDLREDTPTGT
jgi:AAA+ ATPase superfamily predicted ATPase